MYSARRCVRDEENDWTRIATAVLHFLAGLLSWDSFRACVAVGPSRHEPRQQTVSLTRRLNAEHANLDPGWLSTWDCPATMWMKQICRTVGVPCTARMHRETSSKDSTTRASPDGEAGW